VIRVVDLTCTYLGYRLTGPVIASASPTTGRIDGLLELEAAGAAAVVLPSAFQEEVERDGTGNALLQPGRPPAAGTITSLPYTDFYEVGVERHTRLVAEAKRRLSIPVIASVNAARPGAWLRHAEMMTDAGADAIELSLYTLVTDSNRTAADVEAQYLRVVADVRAAVEVPLSVKLSPFFSALPHFATQVVEAGADGLVLFNRFLQPDRGPRMPQGRPTVPLSGADELRLPLRWLAILRPQLGHGTSLAASTGVYSGLDVAKAVAVGADVAAMTSAVLRFGPRHVRKVLDDLVAWLKANEVGSIGDLRRSLEPATESSERNTYVQVLSSYLSAPAV
jgi:dihydroorotate dehydrogenase (fumarate)